MIRRRRLISTSPDIQCGKPCLRGTRITVDSIKAVVDRLSVWQIMNEFPGATPEGIEAARTYRPARAKGKIVTETNRRALLFLSSRHPRGSTCSELGIHLYPTNRPTQNRAREGGAVLRRLFRANMVARGSDSDGIHTTWTLTSQGRKALESGASP